jgi:hypothetical protein
MLYEKCSVDDTQSQCFVGDINASDLNKSSHIFGKTFTSNFPTVEFDLWLMLRLEITLPGTEANPDYWTAASVLIPSVANSQSAQITRFQTNGVPLEQGWPVVNYSKDG